MVEHPGYVLQGAAASAESRQMTAIVVIAFGAWLVVALFFVILTAAAGQGDKNPGEQASVASHPAAHLARLEPLR